MFSPSTEMPPAVPPAAAGTPGADAPPSSSRSTGNGSAAPRSELFIPQVEPSPPADAAETVKIKPAKTEKVATKLEEPSEEATWFDRVRKAISASVSVIVHLLLFIALALWMLSSEDKEHPLNLATSWSEEEGDTMAELEEFAPSVEIETSDAIEAEVIEVTDPFDQIEMPAPVPADPILDTMGVVGGGSVDGDVNQVLQGRAAGNRAALVLSGGGNEFSEEAVALGLKWLARHQHSDGHWSLHEFHLTGDCNGQCTGGGSQSNTAATALALLPFLGAGQTHRAGEYQDVVDKGLKWLVRTQQPDGGFLGPDFRMMYGHGQAAIVLCEAYAMTHDSFLREPAQKAIDFIIDAQNAIGGWRYVPEQTPGDTSVFGWQIMALRSARMAHLEVPDKTFELADTYLERAQVDEYGSRYAYQPRGGPEAAMTAEGLLCRQYSGWRPDEPGIARGVNYLLQEHFPNPERPNIYYWYYGTQVLHHLGGPNWAMWNSTVRDAVINSQHKRGHMAGSWDAVGPQTSSGGRLYMTAMSICILEVYYRHMPLYGEMAVK